MKDIIRIVKNYLKKHQHNFRSVGYLTEYKHRLDNGKTEVCHHIGCTERFKHLISYCGEKKRIKIDLKK